MKSLTKEHFCYGAILSAIMEYNPDSSFVLLQSQNNSRKIFKIQTNTSNECVILSKYAFQNDKQSWIYNFSEKDKEIINNYYNEKIPIFIYLLCATNNLFNSEITVLRYEEFIEVSHKKSITIRKRKGSHSFILRRSKSSKDDMLIPTTRIDKTFDDLISEEINLSHGYYCPKCGTELIFK